MKPKEAKTGSLTWISCFKLQFGFGEGDAFGGSMGWKYRGRAGTGGGGPFLAVNKQN